MLAVAALECQQRVQQNAKGYVGEGGAAGMHLTNFDLQLQQQRHLTADTAGTDARTRGGTSGMGQRQTLAQTHACNSEQQVYSTMHKQYSCIRSCNITIACLHQRQCSTLIPSRLLYSFLASACPHQPLQVSFGHVVNSPLPPQRPLAVVQPQEGCKVVSDSNSRYEFELFSGSVTSCSSEALQPSDNPLLAAARLLGVWRRLPVSAVHEMVVMAPDGTSRTFRMGTATADVPAQLGERVTVVCAPNKGRNKLKRLVLSTSPPGTQPGQPMLICNHRTGAELQLLRPPLPGSQSTVPGWLLPAAVLLAGGDAASSLLDPSLPLLIGGGVAVTLGSAVAGNSLLLPRLKQLPSNAVKLDTIRQQLLAQHAGLDSKVKATMQVGTQCRSLVQQ
jgi:hypothetical protein